MRYIVLVIITEIGLAYNNNYSRNGNACNCVVYGRIFCRDRTPFIFTSDMAYVINEGSPQSATSRYQHFVDNCCKAFNLLRKKYSLLVNLMKMARHNFIYPFCNRTCFFKC